MVLQKTLKFEVSFAMKLYWRNPCIISKGALISVIWSQKLYNACVLQSHVEDTDKVSLVDYFAKLEIVYWDRKFAWNTKGGKHFK